METAAIFRPRRLLRLLSGANLTIRLDHTSDNGVSKLIALLPKGANEE
jgi:hypothetical protein